MHGMITARLTDARARLAGTLLTAALTVGCAAHRPLVPLFGDASTLAGAWAGRYESEESGRAGPIVFRLTAGADTAHGDVVMLVPRSPQEAPGFYPAGSPGAWPALPAQEARILTIRFVQVDGGRVRGRLDPYADPACGCTVETMFEGVHQGDVISGTFVSRHLDRPRTQHGRWQVRRE